MDISSIALQGLEQAQLQLQSAASQLSSATTASSAGSPADTVDLSVAAVSMISAKEQSSTSVDAMKIADEVQKTLLSLLA